MNNFFAIERQRSALAKEKAFKKLLATYSKKYPYISDENSAKLWDKLNREHNTSCSTNPMEMDKLHTVARNLSQSTGNILNIGFGSGNLEAVISQKIGMRNFRWEGIDISVKSVKDAQKKYKGCRFYTGDIRTYKLKNQYYDVVLALEVLEHIQPFELIKVVRKIYKSLKPGGKFIISVPLNEGLEQMLKNGINPNAHVRDYSEELIKAELMLAKFTIEESYLFYAFNTHYGLKKLLPRLIPNFRQPNGILVIASKKK